MVECVENAQRIALRKSSTPEQPIDVVSAQTGTGTRQPVETGAQKKKIKKQENQQSLEDIAKDLPFPKNEKEDDK